MDRWRGKVAVVTGASSGIGVAVVKDLIKHGVKVVALARREDRLKSLRDGLQPDEKVLMYPLKCDVTKENEVKSSFAWVDKNLGGVDILVNNAGVSKIISILNEDNSQAIRDTVDTNVVGLVICTREAFSSMKRRNVDGHIFLLNSVAGHRVPDFGPNLSTNVYAATKYAVTGLTDTYRMELAHAGTKIKVTSISPGATDTELFPPEFEPLKKYMTLLEPEDISEAIIYALSTRPHVQVHEITINPVALDVQKAIRQHMEAQKK